MDQTESHIKQNIEETRASMSQKIEMIEGRMHDTMEGTKSTIDNVVNNINRVKGTIEDTKSIIDTSIDTLRQAVDETVERVKSSADLIDQVKQNPWIMLASAILVGYIMGGLNQHEALGFNKDREHMRSGFEPQRPVSTRASF
jgi:ElaB/YqjD/DUF883 family membrane-anchored ribosome-binding protein